MKGAEREETKKNKKIIFNSKREFGKESFIYDIPQKCLKFEPLSLLPKINKHPILAKHNPLLDVLSWYSLPPVLFQNFSETAFFFANGHNIYYSHKTDRKANRLSPNRLL